MKTMIRWSAILLLGLGMLASVGGGAIAQGEKPADPEAQAAPESPNLITLPNSGSTSSAGTAWAVTNTGTGRAGLFVIANTSNVNPALQGNTESTAANAVGLYGGVLAPSPGSSSAGVKGVILGTNANGYGVYGQHRGSGIGVYGQVLAAGGRGVVGINSATSGAGKGIYGESRSSAGFGVHGDSPYVGVYGTGRNTGVWGVGGPYGVYAEGSTYAVYAAGGAYGVYGFGENFGVYGSSVGIGVEGHGSDKGVYGQGNNYGVQGQGGARGVYGIGSSHGVYGQGGSTGTYGKGDDTGVYGYGNRSTSFGVYGSGGAYGVYGAGGTYGLYGTGNSYGVYGQVGTGSNKTGVLGWSSTWIGVEGSGNWGVIGRGPYIGVYGEGRSFGVYGKALVSSAYAGYFEGKLYATSYTSLAATKVRAEHPLDAGKYLDQVSIVGSEQLGLRNGNVTLDAKGEALVALPAWFDKLYGDFRYVLTPIGGWAQIYVAEKIAAGRFKIAGGKPGLEVSWQVSGVRQDAYARQHPLLVEVDKAGDPNGSPAGANVPPATGAPEAPAAPRPREEPPAADQPNAAPAKP